MGRGRDDHELGAIEQLFRQEYGRLVVVLTGQLRDRGAAEECVQDAFVEAVRRWKKISVYDDPTAWIWLVALRRATKVRRRAARSGVTAPPAAPPDLDALIDLYAAVDRLPERQRQVVMLHYFADLPVASIASALGISEGTVKSQLHDARTALRAGDDERSPA